MKSALMLVCALILTVMLAPLANAATAAAAGALNLTPEQVKAFFDANAILIMFVWGLAVKYVPGLAGVPNVIIPWLNLAGYILAKFVMPGPASAAAFDTSVIPGMVSVLASGFINATWARQLYEGFGRSILENWLGLHKAIPAVKVVR